MNSVHYMVRRVKGQQPNNGSADSRKCEPEAYTNTAAFGSYRSFIPRNRRSDDA